MLGAIKKEMERTGYFSKTEATDAIEFVESLMEAMISHTQKNEPQATESIREMKIAKSRVTDLYHEVEEAL